MGSLQIVHMNANGPIPQHLFLLHPTLAPLHVYSNSKTEEGMTQGILDRTRNTYMKGKKGNPTNNMRDEKLDSRLKICLLDSKFTFVFSYFNMISSYCFLSLQQELK